MASQYLKNSFILLALAFAVCRPSLAVEDPPAEDSALETKSAYQPSPLNFGFDIQYLFANYPNYTLSNTAVNPVNHQGTGIAISFEWLPITSFGKLGVGGTVTGYWLADVLLQGGASGTSNIYSIQPTVSYHADFFVGQFVVPYIKLGPTYAWAFQRTNGVSGSENDRGIAFSIGGEFLLNFLEPKTGRLLDSNYGVNGSYVIVDFTKVSLHVLQRKPLELWLSSGTAA